MPTVGIGVLVPVIIYFDDMDPLGMLHNSRYQVLVERAWGTFWIERGFGGGKGLEGDSFNVVKAFTITYDVPVAMFGDYTVHLWVERLGTTSATAGFRLASADGVTTYAHGSRTVVRLDTTTLLPTPWSDRAREVAGTIQAT
ncbi:acyl-CoA thioester hydrolase [Streptomyces sp. DvalAA-14]|uniref:acyl-CoA thioesterase n=1 Tax=unclassified Streptomyces TaxID=2593676 RepID=UPI00081B30FE|nr:MULTISPECIES: acyl-CoA thioesterase [unclassified Streptomyces]MYS20123.1 acyl-CoA thioesterase [Streptomyces sp. SID4948]SCD61412.1 acyl-CoA thioester hydrolase [Streptomyces sp. DvalAA-14]